MLTSIATILSRSYTRSLRRDKVRPRSCTTASRSSARYVLSSLSFTSTNSRLDTCGISYESLGSSNKDGPESVRFPYDIFRRMLTNSHTGMIRGPSSTMSPAQRVRLIASVTVAATTVTAIIGVWMRYQGYTFKGIWSWFGRTSLFGSTRT
jgi:hypothetical protein